MKKTLLVGFICVTALSFLMVAPGVPARAEEGINYACSAQIFEAFERTRLDAFTKKTGIKVDLQVFSSTSAVNALVNGASDIASSARKLYYRHKEYGYLEFPFCRDPLAVIVTSQNPVNELSEEQLKDIFLGHTVNWKEVGGPDKPITVIVPGKNTAAYKNFSQMAVKSRQIVYDLMSYKSTMVIEAVKQFPWSVSFIAQGAARQKGIKSLKIDGQSPEDLDYPYFQVFSFITKGKPTGNVKQFIDFALSEKGTEIMKAKGMLPLTE